MRIIQAAQLIDPVRRLCLRACCNLPNDAVESLLSACEREEAGSAARSVLGQLLENQRLARESARPICQDTGMAVVFADIGQDVFIQGDLTSAVNEGVRLAYTQGYLRKSVLDPLTRINTGDNTPAVLHIRFVPGETVLLTVAPKGFGSENMSRLFMLPPSAGIEGILTHILTAVQDAVEATLGRRPEASTTGGTSDARFIRALCPVLELGLVGQTMHQIDERVPEAELRALTDAYQEVIATVFERLET